MQPQPLGARAFLNDFRLAAFYIGLLVGAVASAIAGTYWGWWAFMWEVALPVRVFGVMGIASFVFLLFYGGLFTSHYYFGWPKQNPLNPTPGAIGGPEVLPVRQYASVDDQNIVFLMVQNEGPTDNFIAHINAEYGTNTFLSIPFPIKWEFESTAKIEIVKGAAHRLQILKPVLTSDGQMVVQFEFFAPNTSDKVNARVIEATADVRLYQDLQIFISLKSAAGVTKDIELDVSVVCFLGHPPTLHPYLIAPLHG